MTKDLDNILAKLKQERGIDFSGYRPSMLRRRISARLAKLGLDDLALYRQRLENDPSECDQLIDVIAINVSYFFRDPIVFEIIAQKILPEIINNKHRAGSKEIRAWSAGCAAGEEPYSMAILIHEALKKDDRKWTVHLFGTDIDTGSLQQAGKATYPRKNLVNTKLGILDEYFEPGTDGFRLKPSVKKMVHFSRDDLTSAKTFSPAESVFGEFDIILCRNVLIYFNHDLQNLVMNKFKRALVPGGYLILGDSETISKEAGPGFRTVDRKNRIYRKCIV
jgi:chemotaxis methyl-accepting protein methylase